jgi:chlorite dismutase
VVGQGAPFRRSAAMHYTRQTVVGVVGGKNADLVALGRELNGQSLDMSPDSAWVRVRVRRNQRYAHGPHPIGDTYGVTEARSYVKYTFLKVDPAWRRRSPEERGLDKREFAAACREFAEEHYLRAYSLVGTRGDCDLMVRAMARSLDPIHELHVLLNQSGLMRFAETPYSYLAMTKESPYSDEPDKPLEPRPGADSKYLIVYPMWKRRDWYRLPGDERMRVMREHIEVARRFGGIETNTAYSFGLDDQEFVVAFDSDDPSQFLDLVHELRATESSAYTESETPIFTCISASLERALDALDGERVRAPA